MHIIAGADSRMNAVSDTVKVDHLLYLCSVEQLLGLIHEWINTWILLRWINNCVYAQLDNCLG